MKIINEFKKMIKIKKLAMYYDINPSTILTRSFELSLRRPEPKRKYLQVGEKCVLSSVCIFEKETGFISIGNRSHIGGGTKLISIDKIEIGDDVFIAWDCTIYDHNSHSIYWYERKNDTLDVYSDVKAGNDFMPSKNWDVVKSAPIKICSKAWIGFGVIILKGVTIGEGAVVGAGSVVACDVEPYTVVAGNPARVVKKIEERIY